MFPVFVSGYSEADIALDAFSEYHTMAAQELNP